MAAPLSFVASLIRLSAMTQHRFIAKKCPSCSTVTSVLCEPTGNYVHRVNIGGAFGQPVIKRVLMPELPDVVGNVYVGNVLEECRTESGEILYRDNGPVLVRCRGCGQWRRAPRVVGHYNPDKKCNAKCIFATGHSCECACGGKNHGKGFSE